MDARDQVRGKFAIRTCSAVVINVSSYLANVFAATQMGLTAYSTILAHVAVRLAIALAQTG